MGRRTTAKKKEEQGGAGAPSWMLTYGDSVTLLLTFFVMLLTFSTPNEEDFGALARGLMAGARRPAIFPGEAGGDGMVEEERRLHQSRLDTEGAEKPPMNDEHPIRDLRKHCDDVAVSELPELKGALAIRIPTARLIDDKGYLADGGRQVLEQVIQLARGRPYSLVVRVHPAVGQTGEPPEMRSAKLAILITEYLLEQAPRACQDIGLSDNLQLTGEALPPGTCEITLLEI